MTIDLFGDLAGILRTAIGDKPGKDQQEIDFKQIKMVLGLDNLPFNSKQGKLVVDAVMSEPVPPALFPVIRENTGKIFNFYSFLENLPKFKSQLQRFTVEFPIKDNREIICLNREIFLWNRE